MSLSPKSVIEVSNLIRSFNGCTFHFSYFKQLPLIINLHTFLLDMSIMSPYY